MESDCSFCPFGYDFDCFDCETLSSLLYDENWKFPRLGDGESIGTSNSDKVFLITLFDYF